MSQNRMQKGSPKGPMKATLPMSSVLKHLSLKGSTGNGSCWKGVPSPDHTSGQRSPGASVYKGKSKGCQENSSMRRTASLDAIYLRGRWPRDSVYLHTSCLQIDKATQTDENDLLDGRKIRPISESEEKLNKIIVRPKIRSNKETSSRHGSPGDQTLDTSSQTYSSCIFSPTFKAAPLSIALKPLPKSSIRSSIEGLNQEIERIVLKTASSESQCCDQSVDYKFNQITPEGHRAPLAEIFRTRSRSVNTQTPSFGGGSVDFPTSHSSGGSSRGSMSPMLLRHSDSPLSDRDLGDQSSPDDHEEGSKLGTSPHINKFLAREPPDGCEKVLLKTVETGGALHEHMPQPCTFKLKPSLCSAFQLLQPAAATTSSEQEVPIVPTYQES